MAIENETFLGTGQSAGKVNVGHSGIVALVATANTGAFSVILQANFNGTWVNVGTAKTATSDPDIVTLPPGTAVRADATSVTTSLSVTIQA